jgi:hypothetical protein
MRENKAKGGRGMHVLGERTAATQRVKKANAQGASRAPQPSNHPPTKSEAGDSDQHGASCKGTHPNLSETRCLAGEISNTRNFNETDSNEIAQSAAG